MIFLRKIFVAVLTAVVFTMMCGCSSAVGGVSENNDENFSAPASEKASSVSEEPATEALPDTSALETAEGSYVYDNAGVLTADEISELNSYCEMLYEKHLINAAVVTSNSLGGKTPYQAAEDAYIEIYQGRGSGLLLLVNNDTNYDYLYRTGSCLSFIPEDADSNAFFWSTKDIINGDYRSAVLRIMQLGERCPLYVFDNIGKLSQDELKDIESTIKKSNKQLSLLITTNGTDSTNEEICKSYCERRYKGDSGYMMMIDTKTNTVTVTASDASAAGFDKAVAAAEKSVKAGDIKAAVENVLKDIK